MAMRPDRRGRCALKIYRPDPDSVRMRHFVGALLPSEQMVAGLVLGGCAFFFGPASIGFWTLLAVGGGWFLNGFTRFVRVGGLRGELARESDLRSDR